MGLSPPVLAAERRAAPLFRHLPPGAAAVAALEAWSCRWPVGEPSRDGFDFCGGRRLPKCSYCAAHAGSARRSGRRGAA